MELNKNYTKILGTDNANTIDDTNSTQIDQIEADMTTIETNVTTLEGNVDQDVTSGSSPTLDGTNITGIPDASLSSGATVLSSGVTDSGKLVKLDADGNVDGSAINDADINLDNVTEGTTNKFFTATEQSKLSGIEALADVTDATNVNAVESDPIVGAVSGIVKSDGLGAISAAVAGTDYAPALGADDNYVTDAEKVVIGNTSGTNTGDNSANSNYANDYRAANFVADTDYQSVPLEGAFADGDKTKLDGIATGADVTGDNAPQAHATSHTDGSDDIQSATSLQKGLATSTQISKLDGIEAGAEVNTVDSVNTQTGVVVLDADDIDDSATAHKFVTATDVTNLGNLSGTNTGDQTISDATITLTDVTTNNASITKHGFLKKLPNNSGQFMDGTGNWSTPSGSGDVLGPATNTDGYIPQWDGTNSKTLKNGISVASILSGATWGDFV